MKVHGACHCGALAWEAEINPAHVSICHCIDCQILTGTAFRLSVPAKAENFRVTHGEPRVYVKIAESGTARAQAFCANCATPAYAADTVAPQAFMLRVGALAERALLPPQREIWCESALPWTAELLPLPKVAKQK